MRIVVVSDRACVRRALVNRLRDEPFLAVAGQAATGDEAVATARLCQAGAVVIDASMTLETASSVLVRLAEKGFCGRALVVDRGVERGDDQSALDGDAQNAVDSGLPLSTRKYCVDSEVEQLVEDLRMIALDLRLPRGVAQWWHACQAA